MPKRALIAAVTLALLCVACISSSTPPVNYGVGARFVPFVVDATDDMGQGNAVALTADGLPYVTYFGYAAELAKGAIAVPRPFGAPSLPGVMLSTGSSDGMWQRGAVDMNKPELATSGVAIPFGPVETPKLDLTTDNSNGTAIAVADDGTVHVAWTMSGAVYHASTKLGGSSTVEKVFDLGTTVEQAGPLGRPGITLDADGAPWIAFTADTSKGQDVHVAKLTGTKWVDTVVATSGACNGCLSPQPTGIGVVGGAPLVVYADPAAGGVASATLHGSTWTTAPVAADASGFGLSFSVSGDTAHAAYYSGAGEVDVATWKDGAWTTTKVSPTADPDATATGNAAASTAVTVDASGTVYVAWEDSGIQLWSNAEGSFAPVEVGNEVSTGSDPSLAASDNGVALSWYETTQQNQMIGFWGDLADVMVAQPSPSLTVSQGPPAGSECGKDGKVALDEVAKGLAFEVLCLVAPADEGFTLTFDNQDPATLHNIAIYQDASATPPALFTGDTVEGPIVQPYKVPALPAGDYYFHCDVHPTMNGAFAVVEGAK
jgi:plastocyanin